MLLLFMLWTYIKLIPFQTQHSAGSPAGGCIQQGNGGQQEGPTKVQTVHHFLWGGRPGLWGTVKGVLLPAFPGTLQPLLWIV